MKTISPKDQSHCKTSFQYTTTTIYNTQKVAIKELRMKPTRNPCWMSEEENGNS